MKLPSAQEYISKSELLNLDTQRHWGEESQLIRRLEEKLRIKEDLLKDIGYKAKDLRKNPLIRAKGMMYVYGIEIIEEYKTMTDRIEKDYTTYLERMGVDQRIRERYKCNRLREKDDLENLIREYKQLPRKVVESIHHQLSEPSPLDYLTELTVDKIRAMSLSDIKNTYKEMQKKSETIENLIRGLIEGAEEEYNLIKTAVEEESLDTIIPYIKNVPDLEELLRDAETKMETLTEAYINKTRVVPTYIVDYARRERPYSEEYYVNRIGGIIAKIGDAIIDDIKSLKKTRTPLIQDAIRNKYYEMIEPSNKIGSLLPLKNAVDDIEYIKNDHIAYLNLLIEDIEHDKEKIKDTIRELSELKEQAMNLKDENLTERTSLIEWLYSLYDSLLLREL